MLSIENFKKKIDQTSRLIGIDLGKKRIGIAICDENKKIATPYKTISKTNFSNFIKELKNIIDENKIQGLIIGYPINMDGSLGPSAQSTKDIANGISKNISIPITLWDERLSTAAAFKLSDQPNLNVSKKIKKIDENSAAFILQGAIDFINN